MVTSLITTGIRVSVLLVLLVLPACIRTKKVRIETNNTQEWQARYYDIPVTTDATPIFDADEAGVAVSFQTEASFQHLQEFYMNEMECFGWQLVWHYCGKELLLVFEKPSRWLSVSARADKKLNTVVIVSSVK